MSVMRPPMNIGLNSVRNLGSRLKQWHYRAIWSWNFSYPYYPFFEILVTALYEDDPNLSVQNFNGESALKCKMLIYNNDKQWKHTYWKYNEQIPSSCLSLKFLLNDQKYLNDYIIKKHRVFNASTCIGIELKTNIVRNHHDW